MADTVRYVSKEFLDYMKTTYGITELDRIPALIVVRGFETDRAFKTYEGEDINDTISVPKNLIAFSEKNGYINKKTKTRKSTLTMPIYRNYFNNNGAMESVNENTSIKFSSPEELRNAIAFSKYKEANDTNTVRYTKNSFDIFDDWNVPTDIRWDEFVAATNENSATKDRVNIGNWKRIIDKDNSLNLETLSPDFRNTRVLVFRKGNEFRFVINNNADPDFEDKYRIGVFKRQQEVKKDVTFNAEDLVVIKSETYSNLSDIISKDVDEYLFMYEYGDANAQKMADSLESFGYKTEESFVKIYSKTPNVYKGCFRKTYYDKISESTTGTELSKEPSVTEEQFKKLNSNIWKEDKLKEIVQKIKKAVFGESKTINGRLLKEENEIDDTLKTAFINQEIINCSNYLYGVIANMEADMSKEYKATENTQELGHLDNKSEYDQVINLKWFLFYNFEQAKKLHSEYVERIEREITEYFATIFESNFNDVFEAVEEPEFEIDTTGLETSSRQIKADIYRIIKEAESEAKSEKIPIYKNDINEVKKELADNVRNAIYAQFVSDYNVNELTDKELTVEDVKTNENPETQETNESSENTTNIEKSSKQIKADIYRIIKEADDKATEKTAVFIEDVKLQYGGKNNFFGMTSNNNYVDNCYLREGGALTKTAHFILDVWSPVTATLEELGSWIDKGMFDMGSSWITMFGKGMKSIGNIAKKTASTVKGIQNIRKGRTDNYKKVRDYLS